MNWVAWRMLTGDRAKYLGTIFGVAFGTLLIAQQTSIFVGLMSCAPPARSSTSAKRRSGSCEARYRTPTKCALGENDVYRIRGVPGASWAVRFFKGLARARVDDGSFRQVMLLGLDDDTLVGAPQELLLGSLHDLRHPDAVILDKAGFNYLWPHVPSIR